jgi:hypothetical protein
MSYRSPYPRGHDVRLCKITHRRRAPGTPVEVDTVIKPWCYCCRHTAGAANLWWDGFTEMTYSEGEPTDEVCFTCGLNLGGEP